jgi:hypothetical protein
LLNLLGAFLFSQKPVNCLANSHELAPALNLISATQPNNTSLGRKQREEEDLPSQTYF